MKSKINFKLKLVACLIVDYVELCFKYLTGKQNRRN